MKTLLVSLATLAVGLAAGIAIMKYAARSAAAPSAEASAPPALPRAGEWDPFTQMRRMQQEMDRMFNQSIEQFRNEPKFNGFAYAPGYSLSLDVREFKDRFEVHSALPDAKASDVNVKLDGDRTLTVEVGNNAKNTSGQGSTSATSEEWGRYSQTIQLPSAVQANKMKVEHHGHELVIILPKA